MFLKSDKNEECFDRLINRLNMSKERFSGLKDKSIEMNVSNRKTKEKKTGISRNVGHTHG